ncbi:hypothetical protein IFO70_09455 [Phormidium tenue FACHB-886]|nr:hypothetical protein [Phormidium tenue FACHB-886]
MRSAQTSLQRCGSLSIAAWGISAIIPAAVSFVGAPAYADMVRGSGTFELAGRSPQRISSVTYEYGREYNRTLFLNLNDGRRIPLRGALEEGDSGVFFVNGSGDADASGILQMTFFNGNPDTVTGRGLLDGQRFTVSFRRSSDSNGSNSSQVPAQTEPLNLLQQGSGIYQVGDRSTAIVRASVAIRADRRVELAFRLADDRLLRLTGELTSRLENAIVVQLTNAGNADASGTANISQGEGSAINSIVIDGTVDRQPLLVDFYR